MTIHLQLPARNESLRPTITVVGVGGAGGNAVNNMIAANLEGVNFVVANTDAQALDHALTDRTIQLGAGITKGLGAGANPDIGRAAAEEACEELIASIQGSNMVFITAGMGGGTGTGAAPVVARIAREQGVLTVGVVTKPFQFEGRHRMTLAEAGLKELQDYVDTLIVIPNQNLFRLANEKTTFADAFKLADEVLHSGVRGVTDLMVKPGLINLDFADIRTVMREMGKAMMGTGEAEGARRAVDAAEAAISNPLLDDMSLKGARALLINITGGPDMTLFEVDEAANRVREEVDADANIIFGSTFSSEMQGKMRVSVVATGIDAPSSAQQQPGASATRPATVAAEMRKPFNLGGPIVTRSEAAKPITKPSYEITKETAKEAVKESAKEVSREAVRPSSVIASASAMSASDIPQQTAAISSSATRAQPKMEAEVAAKEAAKEKAAEKMPEKILEPVMAEQTAAQAKPAAVEKAVKAEKPAVSAKEEMAEEQVDATFPRGFFQRMADVGRAFSHRNEAAVSKARAGDVASERELQVVEKPRAEAAEPAATKAQDDEQYLDIPAFLRRQAN